MLEAQPMRGLFTLSSSPLMSSRHHDSEPHGRWHATIYLIPCPFHTFNTFHAFHVCVLFWNLHCAPLQWYRAMLCTTNLHCAPLTYVVVTRGTIFFHVSYQLPPRWCTLWCCQSRCITLYNVGYTDCSIFLDHAESYNGVTACVKCKIDLVSNTRPILGSFCGISFLSENQLYIDFMGFQYGTPPLKITICYKVM